VSEGEELVRRLFEAHNRGGGDALLDIYDDLFDDDVEWKPLIVGVVGFPERVIYRGRAGMERYYRERSEAFGGGEVHIRSVEQAGDAVIVDARSTARGRVSGASIEEDISLVYWVSGGKIVRGQAFRAREDAVAAAGA
jgi:ketosteroid isomerase-like protein